MSKAKEMLLAELNERQREAVEHEGHVIVTAGAGTGKTKVLTARVLSRLAPKEGEARDPESAARKMSSVMVVTFTRKATAEMRERIITTLKDISEGKGRFGGVPEQERAYWRGLLNHIDLLHISTIDSMAHRVMERITGGEKVISVMTERREETRLEEDIHAMVVEAYHGLVDPNLAEAVESFPQEIREAVRSLLERFPEDQLESLLKSLYQSQRTEFTAQAKDEELSRLYGELEKAVFISVVGPILKMVHTDEIYHFVTDFLQYQLDLYKNKKNKEDAIAKIQYDLDHITRLRSFKNVNEWLEYAASLDRQPWEIHEGEKPKFNRHYSLGTKGHKYRDQKELLEPLLHMFTLNASYSNMLQLKKALRHFDVKIDESDLIFFSMNLKNIPSIAYYSLVRPVYLLLRLLHERRKRDLERLGIQQRDELTRKVLEELTENTDLATRLYPSLSHVMVDEFQDTNTIQWRIIHALALAPDGTHRAQVFVVGDEKQAIYGFRGGEARMFEVAREDLASTGPFSLKEVFLEENYRSGASIIAVGNSLAASMDYEQMAAYPSAKEPHPGEVLWTHTLAVHPGTVVGNLYFSMGRWPGKRTGYSPDTTSAFVAALVERTGLDKDTVTQTLEWMYSTLDYDPKDTGSLYAHLPVALMGRALELLFDGSDGAKKELAQGAEAGLWPLTLVHLDPRKDTVGILLRKRTGGLFSAIKRELSRRGIDFVVIGENNFFSTPHISSVAILLAALLKPYDRALVTGLLLSPLVGLTLREAVAFLAGYFRQAGRNADIMNAVYSTGEWWDEAGLSERSRSRLEELRELLTTLGTLLDHKSLAHAVAYVMEHPLVWSVKWDSPPEQVRYDLGKLVQMVQSETSVSYEETVMHLLELAKGQVTEARAEVPHFESRPVQLFTQHGSKGLEFSLVMLPGLEQGLGIRNDRGWWHWRVEPFALSEDPMEVAATIMEDVFEHKDPPDLVAMAMLQADGTQWGRSYPLVASYLYHLSRMYEYREQLRLMYVAATRAKKVLWFLSSSKLNYNHLIRLVKGEGLLGSKNNKPTPTGLEELGSRMGIEARVMEKYGLMYVGKHAKTAPVGIDASAIMDMVPTWLSMYEGKEGFETRKKEVEAIMKALVQMAGHPVLEVVEDGPVALELKPPTGYEGEPLYLLISSLVLTGANDGSTE